jgi:GMP synthase-like glutamine amidotransferase
MKYLSIIQHTQSEFLGHIEDHLEGRGIRFGYNRPFTGGGHLPDLATIGDGLILVGSGPWGTATQGRLLPTLDAEVRLTRACLMLGKPVLALGVGSQILAIAAEGGSVEKSLTLTVGTARRVKDGALAGRLPAEFPMITYGRDHAAPPDYAEILAVDEDGLPAVFQVGPNAFGFAGHPGLRPAMIEDLIMEFDEVPENTGAVLPSLTSVGPKIEDALVPIMTGIIELTGWMDS